jgi:hypothetical protein
MIWDRVISFTVDAVINLGTLPYYRFFRQNTLLPILNIVNCVRRGENDAEMTKVIAHWRERKLYELQFIQIAVSFIPISREVLHLRTVHQSTILAAGVVGCFSWTSPLSGYWLGPALWYSSLVLSILAILLSSSQAFIFTSLNEPTAELHSDGDYRRYLALIMDIPTSRSGEDEGTQRASVSGFKPRWKMVFTWQSPMMFMAYGVLFFLLGLTLYVCTPFFNGEVWTAGVKVRLISLLFIF